MCTLMIISASRKEYWLVYSQGLCTCMVNWMNIISTGLQNSRPVQYLESWLHCGS